ncbi:MAG: hypothetical protein ACE5ET_07100, partial [Gammaproteobacteria bacterium]
YKRLVELEARLRQEVSELFGLGEQADQGELSLPAGLVIEDEIQLRQERLKNLAAARAVLETRAQERYEQEKAAYDAKMAAREKKRKKTKRGVNTRQKWATGFRLKRATQNVTRAAQLPGLEKYKLTHFRGFSQTLFSSFTSSLSSWRRSLAR